LVDEFRGTWTVSIRRACSVLRTETSTYHYEGKRRSQAAPVKRIKEIAETRVRYGYCRIQLLLKREGWPVNAKRIHRLYKELGLQLRNKGPKRRVRAKFRQDRCPAVQANETWAMDFVHDQLATGRKIRFLYIVDTFTRFSPALEPRFWVKAADVVDVLERVGRQVGLPRIIRVDQGPEFVSPDLDLQAHQRGVTLDISPPGKPRDNAFIESLNGKSRAEYLDAHWSISLEDARRKMEDWHRHYNEERPHSAIRKKPPDCARESVSGLWPAQTGYLLGEPSRAIQGWGATYADERGTREYNFPIGARRAQAAENHRLSKGVQADRISTTSWGKEQPVLVCDDISCRSQNRRAVTLTNGAGGS
jgi:putative transposase